MTVHLLQTLFGVDCRPLQIILARELDCFNSSVGPNKMDIRREALTRMLFDDKRCTSDSLSNRRSIWATTSFDADIFVHIPVIDTFLPVAKIDLLIEEMLESPSTGR